ncbi:MAG: radical SAM protein [bacterium]|nr:radical SAM protein [bacterium]
MAELRWITTDTETGKTPLFYAVVERRIGRGAYRGLEFLHVESRTLINRIPNSKRMPFEYTINAYRGCSHACTYCFARPSHDYLGLGIGRDFDTKIVVKINAPEILAYETAPQRWAGHPIAMGTNTDPYQAAEGKYKLTRSIIEILADRGNPFSILTKSPLVLRDLKLLEKAARVADVSVNFSIATLDQDAWARTEPGTAHPRKRLEAVKRLNEAGIRSGVLMMPILPGITDRPAQVEELVKEVIGAGAYFVAGGYLHVRNPLKDHFLGWIEKEYPHLARFYRHLYGTRSYPKPDMRRRLGRWINRAKARYDPAGPTRNPSTRPPAKKPAETRPTLFR